MHDESKEEGERKRRKLEEEFVEKFTAFHHANEALSSTDATDASSKSVHEDIEKLLKEMEQLKEMIALANKKSDDSQVKLKRLREEKMLWFGFSGNLKTPSVPKRMIFVSLFEEFC